MNLVIKMLHSMRFFGYAINNLSYCKLKNINDYFLKFIELKINFKKKKRDQNKFSMRIFLFTSED